MKAIKCTLQDKLKTTPIHEYYLSHPQNAALNTIMTEPRKLLSHESPIQICYREILKSDPTIIYDIISDISPEDIAMLTLLAIDQYNKEMIEFIYKSETIRITKKHSIINSLAYGYEKNGAEIIYFMGELGIPVYLSRYLFIKVIEKNDMDLIRYIIDLASSDQKNLNELFLSALEYEKVIKLFIYRVDVSKLKEKIFEELLGEFDDDDMAVESIKLLVDYFGMTMDDNKLLKKACRSEHMGLIEFCLQYGMQVESDTLRRVLKKCHIGILELFVRYNVDFSLLKVKNVSKIFSEMEDLGLDKNALLHLLVYK